MLILLLRRRTTFTHAPPVCHRDRRRSSIQLHRSILIRLPLRPDQQHHHDDDRYEQHPIQRERNHHQLLVRSQLADFALQVVEQSVVVPVDVIKRLASGVLGSCLGGDGWKVIRHARVIGIPSLQPIMDLDETLVLNGLDVGVDFGVHEVVVPAMMCAGDDRDLLSGGIDELGSPFGGERSRAPRIEFTVDDEEIVPDDVPALELRVEGGYGSREVVRRVGAVGEWEVVRALALSICSGDLARDDR